MKIVFIGLGSIGQRHLSIVKKNYPEHELFHFYTDGIWPGLEAVHGWKDLEKIKPDVTFICNPTNYHIDTAFRCANLGVNLFIEKPLGVEAGKSLDTLLDIVEKKRLTAYVAYPFRHSNQIESIRNKINDKIKTARIVCRTDITRWGKEYSRKSSTGGGAIFELSHEIDYARYLFGPVRTITGRAMSCSNSFTNAETGAVMNCFHESGFTSRIELDLLSKSEERFISLQNQEISMNGNPEMYSNQIKYFFDNIDNPNLTNNVFEAAELFRKIVDFKARKTQCRS